MSNNSLYNENSRKAPERAFSRVASEVIVNTVLPVTSVARYNLQNQVRAMYTEEFFPVAAPQVSEQPAQAVSENVVDIASSPVDQAQQLVEDAYRQRDIDLEQAA